MPLRLVRARDADHFDQLAFDFLAAREAEHNLLFGIVAGVRSGGYARPPYFAVVRDGERVVAAALRTPPFRLVLSSIDDAAALPLFVDDAALVWPDLPGVLGPKGYAGRFAALWQERTGMATTLHAEERVFQLRQVRRPPPIAGAPRLADARDRAVIIEWLVAFATEALGQPGDPNEAAFAADRSIAMVGGRSMYVWDDGGPVSLTGVAAVTPRGSRIGPVYTPPDLRGRGYASALVAAASQQQLDDGREFCFLFTDLANPTSNKIYEAIGYEPVCDMDEYRFAAPVIHAPADT